MDACILPIRKKEKKNFLWGSVDFKPIKTKSKICQKIKISSQKTTQKRKKRKKKRKRVYEVLDKGWCEGGLQNTRSTFEKKKKKKKNKVFLDRGQKGKQTGKK